MVIWHYSRNRPTRTRKLTSRLLIHRLQVRVRLQRAARVRLQPQLQSPPVGRRAKSSRRLTRRRAKRKKPEQMRRAIKATRLTKRRTRGIRRRVLAAASRRRPAKIDFSNPYNPQFFILQTASTVYLSPSKCLSAFFGASQSRCIIHLSFFILQVSFRYYLS